MKKNKQDELPEGVDTVVVREKGKTPPEEPVESRVVRKYSLLSARLTQRVMEAFAEFSSEMQKVAEDPSTIIGTEDDDERETHEEDTPTS